ncbi:Ypt/Rab-GAP domain of gyp1p superfamily protein [Striga asiatica]|uniref:Ypt/Rab-GAP domain of gyp1p superfamily protein n=1 Tax=Striga asiatica TaxID=4170 RepID=A0A5A7PSH0_STRAF|nr:Ypt/Rab-GAP domain of gyp1p superfamily protein [Striga asiatica]
MAKRGPRDDDGDRLTSGNGMKYDSTPVTEDDSLHNEIVPFSSQHSKSTLEVQRSPKKATRGSLLPSRAYPSPRSQSTKSSCHEIPNLNREPVSQPRTSSLASWPSNPKIACLTKGNTAVWMAENVSRRRKLNFPIDEPLNFVQVLRGELHISRFCSNSMESGTMMTDLCLVI